MVFSDVAKCMLKPIGVRRELGPCSALTAQQGSQGLAAAGMEQRGEGGQGVHRREGPPTPDWLWAVPVALQSVPGLPPSGSMAFL